MTISVKTYTSPYKPIPATVPDWDPAVPATWPATTSTLVSTGGRAILVDALMTVTEGNALADWITANRVVLEYIYVTHGHADHFFGATQILRRIPTATLIARPDVAAASAEQATPGYLQVWNGFFPGQLPDPVATPEEWPSGELLDGVVRLVGVGTSDVPISSVVEVPELQTVICGDVAYNDMHMWLVGSSPESRTSWLSALDSLELLRPRKIIAGHRNPAAADDDARRILDQSRAYISEFDRVAASAGSPAEMIMVMSRAYPSFGNPYTLALAAQSAFVG